MMQQAVDLLVANAALNCSGRHVDLDDKAIIKMIDVNFVAPLVMAASAVRHNKKLDKPPPAMICLCSLSHQFSYPGGES